MDLNLRSLHMSSVNVTYLASSSFDCRTAHFRTDFWEIAAFTLWRDGRRYMGSTTCMKAANQPCWTKLTGKLPAMTRFETTASFNCFCRWWDEWYRLPNDEQAEISGCELSTCPCLPCLVFHWSYLQNQTDTLEIEMWCLHWLMKVSSWDKHVL